MILQDEVTTAQPLCTVSDLDGRTENIPTGIVTGAGSVLLSPPLENSTGMCRTAAANTEKVSGWRP